jgi:large subunit ribosomal protein L18e
MENKLRIKLAGDLRSKARETRIGLWSSLSEDLLACRSNRSTVNVGVISRYSRDGAKVVVPGKVLAGGNLSHKVRVIAFEFSEGARQKIANAGGSCEYLADYLSKDSSAKDVILLG